jgi:4-alpha-glucanotransferase
MSRPIPRSALARAATANGVQTSYRDVDHATHRASRDALEAVLAALGVDPRASPGGIRPDGSAGRAATGEASRGARGAGERDGAPAAMPVVERPSWGVFLPLHALRTNDDRGVGSFTDLAELYRWTVGQGGTMVGTLPLLAQFLDEPFEPSPYAPASRLFWNELFVDPAATAEFARSREARRLAGRAPRPRSRLVDYRAAYAAARPVLEALALSLHGGGGDPARRGAFERYRRSQPHLDDYARFRAFGERTRSAWQEWPARQRAGRVTPVDVDADAVRFHQYVQFVADEQLGAIGATEPGHGLYLDLPLGVHGSSFDTWRFRDAFAIGVSGGAPPDTFFTAGQAWGFPPLHPWGAASGDFAYVRACLRHLMRHAGVMRIDHVMGLHRLYWVPDGLPATEGVYVRYPAEELYAVLADEAHRAGTAVVGEDLGTVPRGVRAAMTRRGVLRSHVLQLEAVIAHGDPLPRPPVASLASLNTHDLFPFAGFWAGRDVDEVAAGGLIGAREARRRRSERGTLTRELTARFLDEGLLDERRAIASEPAAADAAHRHLALGPSRMVVVNVEDLWGETEPQNRPGSSRERPNWRRRAARTFESFRSDPAIMGRLEEVNRLRDEVALHERRATGAGPEEG